MENKRNYYRLLHVQFDAPAEVIKGSYRTMMQKMRLHPDLGGSEANAQLLNEALATLLDPEKRALYDQWLQNHQPHDLRANIRPTNTSRDVTSSATNPSSQSFNKTEAAGGERVECFFCHLENHLPKVQHRNWTDVVCICRNCSAPLRKPAKFAQSVSSELRRIHRSKLQTLCEIQVSPESEKTISAEVENFSVLGLSVNHSGRLSNGVNVLIRSEKFNCVARVNYSNTNMHGKVTSGLEFLSLDLELSKGELFTARY